MCMEDIRIMRRTRSRMFSLTVQASGVIVGPSPNRVALIITTNGALRVVGTERNMVVTAGRGIAVGDAAGASAHIPLILDIQHHGALVTEAWYGTPGQVYIVGESYLDEQ